MFKAGDRVRNKATKEIDVVIKAPGDPHYDSCGYQCAEEGFVLKNHIWQFQKDWELLENQGFDAGDLVKIIQRLPDNQTGGEDYRLPNGDVGKVGRIKRKDAYTICRYLVEGENNEYFGWFSDQELALVNTKGSMEPGDIIPIKNNGLMVGNKKTFMESVQSIIQAVKAKLSLTDRTLVKNGFLTEKGERTQAYEQELLAQAQKSLIEAQDTPEFRAQLAEMLNAEKSV